MLYFVKGFFGFYMLLMAVYDSGGTQEIFRDELGHGKLNSNVVLNYELGSDAFTCHIYTVNLVINFNIQ